MVKRRTGSVKRFGGGFRRWIEGKHPRDARGRFAEVPDVYVPARSVRRSHLGVDRWEKLHIWDRPEVVPERFTISAGGLNSPDLKGFPLREDEGRPPWLRGDGSYVYFDPSLTTPVYFDPTNGGLSGIRLGPSWWDLTPEERRHAMYAVAGAKLSLAGSPYEGGIPAEAPLFADDTTLHTDLNGFTSESDVAGEAYALLADGDGPWLEQEYPGLAEVVRREAAAQGLPVDDGPIADPDENDTRFAYGREPLLPEEPDPDMELGWRERHDQRAAYEDEILAMVSRGDITVDDGAALISMPSSADAWHPLPENLWHVSTNAPAIIAEGFKSRDQLGQSAGIGLGGGPSNVVSFTSSIEVAQNVYSAMLEARAFAAGDIKMRDLLDLDSADTWHVGAGAVTKAWAKINVGPVEPGVLPQRMADALDAEPSDETWDIYREWIRARASVEGPDDPMFFATDWRGLGAVDPADIAILEITPEEDRFGQALGAQGLHEWRVHPAALPTEIDRVFRPAVSEDLLPRRTLYRGLEGGFHTPAEVADILADPEGWLSDGKILERVGEHWSEDFNVASSFARMGGAEPFTDAADWLQEPEDPEATHHLGILIQAAVPESGILEPGTAEWRDTADALSIYDPDHPEAEATVDRGTNLRIEGIWLTVTDDSGADSEIRLDLARLADIQPLDRIQAIQQPPRQEPRVDGAALMLDYMQGDAARYMAMAELLGLPVGTVNIHGPDEKTVRAVGEGIQTEPTLINAMSKFGFGPDRDIEVPPYIAASVVLFHGDRFGIDRRGNLTFTLPSGEVLTRDVGGVLTGERPGVALARHLTPEMAPDGAPEPWRNNTTRMIQAVLLNELDPTLRSSQALAARFFAYDRNSTSLPRQGQHWDGRARQLLGDFLSYDIADSMAATYDSLVRVFPDTVFEDMIPLDEDAYLGIETADHGIAAFVNSAGVLYVDPYVMENLDDTFGVAVPTHAGVMAHEFAHRLFSGAATDPEQMQRASFAFENARRAAEAKLGAPIMTGVTTLSPYANTEPSEGFAELFSVYWAANATAPDWVLAWGDEFVRSYQVALNARDLPPITRRFVDLQGGNLMAILGPDDFDPDLPRPPLELRTNLIEDGVTDPIDNSITADLFQSHAERVVDAMDWPGLSGITVDSPEFDRFEVAGWPLGRSTHVELFELTADRVTFPPVDPEVPLTRQVINAAVKLYIDRTLGETSQVRLSFDGPFPAAPPLEGVKEMQALFRAITGINGPSPFTTEEGLPSETYTALRDAVQSGAFTSAEEVWKVPGVAEFFSTYEGRITVNLDLDRDYLARRREVVAEDALELIDTFDRRPDPLADRRRDKLSTVYGEAFRTEVEGVVKWLPHPPLVHLPTLADEEGVDLEDFADSRGYTEQIEAHFRGWSHTAEVDGALWTFTADTNLSFDGNTIEVNVDFDGVSEEGYGTTVGRSTRKFDLGGATVDHELLELEDWVQGVGLGFSWNRHNDPWYLANGIPYITVQAGLTEGGYAWASDFFTMTNAQRDSFLIAIKRRAQDVVAHAGDDENDAELISALQALVDIEVIEDSPSYTGWELAHIGYHDAVAQDRSWIARQVLQGKGWGGSKNLAELVEEATGEPIDYPTADSVPSMKDDWHPFWQRYTNPTEQEGLLSEWVENTAEGDFEWVSDTVLRSPGGRSVILIGGDTPYVDATDLNPDEAAEIFFSLAAAAKRNGAFSDVDMRVNPGDGEEISAKVASFFTERVGPASLNDGSEWYPTSQALYPFGVASEYVHLVPQFMNSNLMEGRVRSALLSDTPSRRSRYSSRGLANPKMPAISMPLSGETDDDGVSTYSDNNGVSQFVVTESSGVRRVTFDPDSDLQPSDRVQILFTEMVSDRTRNGINTLVSEMPMLIEPQRFTSAGWTYFAPDPGARGLLAVKTGPTRTADPWIVPPWARSPITQVGAEGASTYIEMTNHVTADGKLYAVGRMFADGGAEPAPDYHTMRRAAESVVRGAYSLRGNEDWDHVVLDLHDRPSASEIVAELRRDLPELRNAAEDAFEWDDEGKLTINIAKLNERPSWLVPVRTVTAGSPEANRQRFTELFRRWEKASHPDDPIQLDAVVAWPTLVGRPQMTPILVVDPDVDDDKAVEDAITRLFLFMKDFNRGTLQQIDARVMQSVFHRMDVRYESEGEAWQARRDLQFRGLRAIIGVDPTTLTIYSEWNEDL